MTHSLYDFISNARRAHHATDAGTRMHDRLRGIVIDDAHTSGNTELVARIRAIPELLEYFGPAARTEVPVAGTVNGRFISRRIDRMVIDTNRNTIKILDYKTDTNPDLYRTKYAHQLREYHDLMRIIYPGFKISTAILWTHDWRLEIL